MKDVEVYAVWAPETALWSRWVKPVLFSGMPEVVLQDEVLMIMPTWAPPPSAGVVLVLDLPGADAVLLGLGLAQVGYRPIPLYNALPAPIVSGSERGGALVDVQPIVNAIAVGTPVLSGAHLPDDAPPAFLLHSGRSVAPSSNPRLFDNRSVVFTTDFPSANFLLSHGIRQVLLVMERQRDPAPDLSHTLARWEDAGLPILVKTLDCEDPPRPCSIPRPSTYRLIWYRVLESLGFSRHVLGGFGGYPPDPSAGG